MSWNRKDWLKLAGLLGLGATGAGLAGVGPLASIMGGASAAGSAGAGAAAGAANTGLLAESVAPVVTEQMAASPYAPTLMSRLGNAASMFGKATSAMGTANTAMGMMQPPPSPPPGPPPQNNFQPTPATQPYGGLRDAPPPGIDPRQWAMMSPEQKRMMMMGRM